MSGVLDFFFFFFTRQDGFTGRPRRRRSPVHREDETSQEGRVPWLLLPYNRHVDTPTLPLSLSLFVISPGIYGFNHF